MGLRLTVAVLAISCTAMRPLPIPRYGKDGPVAHVLRGASEYPRGPRPASEEGGIASVSYPEFPDNSKMVIEWAALWKGEPLVCDCRPQIHCVRGWSPLERYSDIQRQKPEAR